VCEGKALPLLWNNAAYFDESCLTGGKLHLFAHFEEIGRRRTTNTLPRAASTDPSTFVNMETSASTTQPSPRSMVDGMTSLWTRKERLILHTRPMSDSQQRKRSRVQDVSSDSDSEGSDETHFLLSPSDRVARSSSVEEGRQSSSGFRPPALPSIATGEQHTLDLQAALSANAHPHQYGFKSNWDDIAKEYRAKIAHARLIHGIYGTTSAVICDRCVKNGVECRVYHPDLKAPSANIPGSCAECRLHSNTCTTAGVHQRTSRKRVSNVESDKRPKKAPRIEVDANTLNTTPEMKTITMFYCPVGTCERHWRGFNHKPNFARHVQCAHPEVDDSQLDEGRRVDVPTKDHTHSEIIPPAPRLHNVTGKFICPLESCKRGFNRGDNFRKHVRSTHPNSIHAQILEAFKQSKTNITLPPPPSRATYTAAFEAAQSTNAPPGSFGHRDPASWTRLHPRARYKIAHAKMINGEFGVIAPESCQDCRKRHSTCMIYHPGLKNVGRVLGSCCGECRDRDIECGINIHAMAKILGSGKSARAKDTRDDAHEDEGADTYEDDDAYALPSPHELDPQISVHSEGIHDDEVPDSDEPEMKVEDDAEGGAEDDEYQPEHQIITFEDLNNVIAAEDGALQIAGHYPVDDQMTLPGGEMY
jgi:hypothetical protein